MDQCKLNCIPHSSGCRVSFLFLLTLELASSPCDIQNRRSGILVLVNDADWELEGELEYKLENGDEIVFISTLHGG